MGLPCLRYGSVGQEVDKAGGPECCQEEDFEDCIIDGISSLCQGRSVGWGEDPYTGLELQLGPGNGPTGQVFLVW